MRMFACIILLLSSGCVASQQCESVPTLKAVHGEATSALQGSDPRALKRALALVERRIEAKPEEAIAEGLRETENTLRNALKKEIKQRVGNAHRQAIRQDNLTDAMREWQVASFYLGLLPEAKSAAEASHYQGLLTEHGLVRGRIQRADRVRYSLWAVRRMKTFAATVDWQHFRPGTDEDRLFEEAAEYLGSIDTERLRPEAMALYQSLLQAAFEELNRKHRVRLVEGIEEAQEQQRK